MKAVAYQKSLPIDAPAALQDVTLPEPVPGLRDLLVEVRAVAVNPVDTKMRMRAAPAPGEWAVLGWDAAGLPAPEYVVSLTQTAKHYAEIVELIAPQGKFGLIDDPASSAIEVAALKRKSLSLHWELMFTRSLFRTADMSEQHRLLDEVARLVDADELRSTLGEHFGRVEAANLRRAHAVLESGKARGKIVLEGF